MEILKEEVRSKPKIALQRNCLVEASQKEEVLRYKAEIHTRLERTIAEKKLSMEKKEEGSPFTKASFLHLRLESGHCFASQVLRIQLFSGRECANVQHQGIKGHQHNYIDIVYYQM